MAALCPSEGYKLEFMNCIVEGRRKGDEDAKGIKE
jgi:hypothetical protein